MKNKIYVFSYDRGIFLENCIRSAEKFATDFFDIAIVDDNSCETETKKILAKYESKYEIFYPKQGKDSKKVGGYFNNISFAFQNAASNGISFVLVLDDDMQIVRKITAKDVQNMNFFFTTYPYCQLSTNFMKRCHSKNKKFLSYDNKNIAYFRSKDYPACFAYSSTGVFHVPRFLETFGEGKDVLIDEEMYNRVAEKKGMKFGIYAYPFMMWLPMPFSYRKKKRSVCHVLKECIAGSGFHPYEDMSYLKKEELFNRSLEKLPYAEDFLSCPQVQHVKQWAFMGVDDAFKELTGWRSHLGNSMVVLFFNLNKIKKFLKQKIGKIA